MRLSAAVRGDLKKIMAGEVAAAEIAVTRGVHRATRDLQQEFRAITGAAGLGRKVARAWGRQTFPRTGRSLGAAGLVYSRAPRIHGAFSQGVTIRPRRGRWLVIPLEPAARRFAKDWRRGADGARSQRQGRWSNIAAAEDVFGKLRFVPLRGGRALLVADRVTAGLRRSKTRSTRSGDAYSPISGRRASVPLFLLVRSVRLTRRFSLEGRKRAALERLPGRILAEWPAVSETPRRGRGR